MRADVTVVCPITGNVCDFCLRLAGMMENRPWYDFHILQHGDQFTVIVALGALVPGHVMIVSNSHIERMADLAAREIVELEALVDEWAQLLTAQWDSPCFIFEHGGRARISGTGGCVAHAHLQLMPLSFRPALEGTRHDMPSLHSALLAVGDRDYLLTSCDESWSITTEHSDSGQFLRRQVSAFIGSPMEWDYLAYPRHGTMRETIGRLTATSAETLTAKRGV